MDVENSEHRDYFRINAEEVGKWQQMSSKGYFTDGV